MRLLIFALALGMVAGTADAQRKGRKLPEKAYIESSQIAIVSGDTTRYREAMAMLDSLFMNYGPHPEGYLWMNQIAVDFIEKSAKMSDKELWVKHLALYRDSLHYACSNPGVKDKYKKDCSKFIEKADSTQVKYWRVFYNKGIEQLGTIEESLKEIKPETDSSGRAYYMKKVQAAGDSALANVALCLILDSTDNKAYMLAGSVAEKQGNLAASNEWLQRGLKYTADSTQILLQIAYNILGENKYCEAIPYLKEYGKHQPSDTGNLLNLTICYNNCKMFDSAAAVNRQILGMNPNHADALLGLGQYFNQLGIWANDSTSAARDRKDDAAVKKWTDQRSALFDSSKVYFKRAFENDPTNVIAVEEYGVVAFVTNDFAGAATAFAKLAELEPNKASHWISLGDAQLNLKKFKDSIVAYEKAVELEPDNRQVWERLADLYAEEGQTAKAAKAKEHLK